MNHGSLFSGIGGFDLAAEWMGWENVFHCEWNPFCKKILNYYWSNAVSYDDITKTDFTVWRGRIDILTGGFPCQPYSVAGKRKGKDDERHLWPEMLRAIREIKPTWVVGENVSGIVNWNAGLAFEEVQTDLEAEGYEVQTYILPAASVNAPHKRDRVWFVTYRANTGNETMYKPKININGFESFADTKSKQSERMQFKQRKFGKSEQREFRRSNCKNVITNTNRELLKWRSDKNRSKKTKRYFSSSFRKSTWENFPTQSPVCNGNDGISSRLDTDTVLESVGRKVNKSFKHYNFWRNESIKAGGNAVVPQVVLQIFKAIQEYQENYA